MNNISTITGYSGWITEWTADPKPIYSAIAISLGGSKEKSPILNSEVIKIVVEYLKNDRFFGEKEWNSLFGRVAPAPPLPIYIDQILQNRCRFNPGAKARETTVLVYIPEEVNGISLTTNSMEKLAEKPLTGKNSLKYKRFANDDRLKYGESSEKAHWALMTKDIVPTSSWCDREENEELLRESTWMMPSLRDFVICLCAHNILREDKIFSGMPKIYTRIQTGGLIAGACDESSFEIVGEHPVHHKNSPQVGTAALIKL